MKLYGIASRLNGREYIVIQENPFGPVAMNTMEGVRKIFTPYYDLVKLEWGSVSFLKGIGQLLLISPAIYTFDANHLIGIMKEWRDGEMTYKSAEPIISIPHLVAPMKRGFLEKFMVLDIVKDIESKTTIDPEGRMRIQEFQIRHKTDGETSQAFEPLTEEKAKELLRKRGLL